MNAKYLIALTTVVLVTGLLQPVTPAQEIAQIRILTATQSSLRADIERERNIDISFRARKRNVLVSGEEDPPPPRPPSPGGSR